MRRDRLALVIVAAVVAVGLLGATGAVAWRLRPRLPSVTTAITELDQAVATVITAAGENAAVALTGLVATHSCKDLFQDKGSFYTRTVDLYTDPGREGALIDQISAAIPAVDHPVRDTASATGEAASLTADLGNGISLQITPLGAGWLSAAALTDCRGGSAPAPPNSTGADTASIVAFYSALGTSLAGMHTVTVNCPQGGQTVTLDAVSRPTTATDNLASRLAGMIPAGVRRFTYPTNRIAWRDHTTSVIIAIADDEPLITIQRTTNC
jgi:hypothetical protein